MSLVIILVAVGVVFLSFVFGLKPSHSTDNTDTDDQFEIIPIVDAVGPESFAFDTFTGEGPYTGVSDGRIIKWNQIERRWNDFAVTTPNRDGCEGAHDHTKTEEVCGRTLGLRFNNSTGDLYIADAYMGLLKVGPKGGLATKLTTEAQGIPFKFTNAVDVDDTTGVVYFTDSSSVYSRKDHMQVTLTGDKTGRLLKYDPNTNETTVILKNLMFPNGVALSKKKDFLIFAETSICRIMRLWLGPSEMAGKLEVFAELPGYPDNIKMNEKGEFWVGLYSKKANSWSWLNTQIRNGLLMLPVNISKKVLSFLAKGVGGVAVKLSEEGEIIEMLEDKNGKVWKFASEVFERKGCLWIGSVVMPYAVKVKYNNY